MLYIHYFVFQLKSLETSLNGALRREKSTENCVKQLEAEIEQLNCLVYFFPLHKDL